MKIVRFFIQERSDDSGIDGFLPMWIPRSANFDPMDARGMVHDMLEHRLCDTGQYHEELMAFGRLSATRGIPAIGFGNYYTPQDNLGVELAGIYARLNGGGKVDLQEAPETSRLESMEEKFLCGVVAKFMATVRGECASYSDNKDEPLDLGDNHAQDMLSWLRIGFLDALRRYGQLDHGCHDTGRCMHAWAEKNAPTLYNLAEENEGGIIRLTFDHSAMRISWKKFSKSPETGAYTGWLRQRELAWRNS